MRKQYVEKVEFFAHLYAGNPNTHRSNDLQMVQDEFLQFGDAAALKWKTKCVLCCLSWWGSAAQGSPQTNVMYPVHIWELVFLCYSHSLTVDILTHDRNTDLATHSQKSTPLTSPAPFILSPPPCRCWMGGLCGRRVQWESYSSCQVPICFERLWSESRHCHSSRMNCCCHST